MTDSLTCWCGHDAWAHRPHRPNPTFGRAEPVIVVRRGECQAKWTERGGMDRVHCNCERYVPDRGGDQE